MTDNVSPFAHMSPPQMTPPDETHPPQVPSSARPPWATVIGVISIVWGSLGLICTPVSLLGNMLSNKINPRTAEMQGRFPDWYATYTIAALLVQVALAVLLLIAGICLLRRSRLARRLHLGYAVPNLLLGAVGLVVAISTMSQVFQESDMPEVATASGMAGAFIGMAFVMVYPIFLLVWFSRRKIREQVQQW